MTDLIAAYPNLTKEKILRSFPIPPMSCRGRNFLPPSSSEKPSLVADENVDSRIIRFLRDREYPVSSIREEMPGVGDRAVLSESVARHALLITEDADFGEWVFSHREPTMGILFLRYHPSELDAMSNAILQTLQTHGDALFSKFTVITPKKIRIKDI
jgi:predicted nuclease of predicted toxin-antitoxin system